MSEKPDFWDAVAERLRQERSEQCSEVAALRERAEKEEAERQSWGIVEFAVRYPNVASYMDHWEKRAQKAERELSEERACHDCDEARALCGRRQREAERERDAARQAHAVCLSVHVDSESCLAAEEKLAEAREDIKALAEVVRAWTKLLNHDYSQEVRGETWRRIRDRRLLEVSDAE